MDNVVSDSPSSGATHPFTVNEELSFEDAWVRVAELLQWPRRRRLVNRWVRRIER